MDAPDGVDGHGGGGDLPGENFLESDDDVGGDGHRVHPLFRRGAVAALAPDGVDDAVGGGHHRPRGGDHRAGGDVRGEDAPDVTAKNAVHTLHDAFLHGDTSAAHCFLSRLEDEAHPARQLFPVVKKHLQRPQKHGPVGIVAAGVHTPFVPGGKGETGLLLDGESIHVGPEEDGFSLPAAGKLADDPGLPRGEMVGDPPVVQLRVDESQGLREIQSQLGDLVQGAAEGNDVLLHGFAFFPHKGDTSCFL